MKLNHFFKRRAFNQHLLSPYWLAMLSSRAQAQTQTQEKTKVPASSASIKKPPLQKQAEHAAVLATTELRFPRDFGAHLEYKTEWWYLSGWLERQGSNLAPLGVQATFFRTRTDYNLSDTNAMAPRQLVLAHMALAVPEKQKLLHDQKSARMGMGVAQLSQTDTDCSLYGWQFNRVVTNNQERYEVRARCNTNNPTQTFTLDLQFNCNAPPVLQGKQGFSQKGPQPEQASHYYSRPQLQATGQIEIDKKMSKVTGTAWLDHEWSSSLLAPDAVGWDWIGINLSDGGSLLAFRLRNKENGNVWSYAVLRDANNKVISERSSEQAVTFTPLKTWRSIVSGAQYPVSQRIEFANLQFSVEPAFEAQEIDGRLSTGGFYWEGAVRLLDQAGQPIGRGYLEMTGYSNRIRI